MSSGIRLGIAAFLRVLDTEGAVIGTKVLKPAEFLNIVLRDLAEDIRRNCDHLVRHIELDDDARPLVSAGVGRRSDDASHYFIGKENGLPKLFLRREWAEVSGTVKVTVCSKRAYLHLCEMRQDQDEWNRINNSDFTHVLTNVDMVVDQIREPTTAEDLAQGLADKALDQGNVHHVTQLEGYYAVATMSVGFWKKWHRVADDH